jgi:hypothetical protein
MLHAGLDLSRRKIDVCLLTRNREHVLHMLGAAGAATRRMSDVMGLKRHAGRVASAGARGAALRACC